jgi:hypothetical protein
MPVHRDKLGPIPDDNWENDYTTPNTKVSAEEKARDEERIRRLKGEAASGPAPKKD